MKGKHTQAAAVRHEVQSRDAEIATYQRAVAKLTAENKALRERMDADKKAAATTERTLRARLAAGAAPEVDALNLLLAEARKERDEAMRRYTHLHRNIGPDMLKLTIDVMTEQGLSQAVIASVVAAITTVKESTPVERIRRRRAIATMTPNAETSPDVAW